MNNFEYTPEVRGFKIDEDEPMRQGVGQDDEPGMVLAFEQEKSRKSDLVIRMDSCTDSSSCFIEV